MQEFVDGRIRFVEHPVRLGGGTLPTRMTVLALADGLVLHSPVPIDDALHTEIERLGKVQAILAPSNCHHLFVGDAQRAFPGVPAYAVEGVAAKRADLALATLPDDIWASELDRVVIGNRVMREVVLFDRASRTVIAVDLVENIGDETKGTDGMVRFWIKLFGMWNKPRPAPEFRLFTRDRQAAREALERILSWDFDRMLFAHGEPFARGAKDALREAWRFILD